ncbi:MAG: response regulator transcription factor [Firmicutes bacterium]|nr:response regulator transcription factor [Bacillota bacterium]
MSKILIIEDNLEIHDMEKTLLTKSGYTTVSAFSGTEGILQLKNDQFDLVILDLMLPGLPGEDVLNIIRKESQVPFLCVTAIDSIESKVKILKMGADDYLVKPFNYDEFLVRVEALLRRSKAVPDMRKLKFRDIEISPDNHEVAVNGTVVDLTRKEYEILELLVKHPKKVFTKENLFESVWNEQYFPEDNTVNVHVSNIRKKLAAAGGADDYIQTVWGIGFKLSGNTK